MNPSDAVTLAVVLTGLGPVGLLVAVYWPTGVLVPFRSNIAAHAVILQPREAEAKHRNHSGPRQPGRVQGPHDGRVVIRANEDDPADSEHRHHDQADPEHLQAYAPQVVRHEGLLSNGSSRDTPGSRGPLPFAAGFYGFVNDPDFVALARGTSQT